MTTMNRSPKSGPVAKRSTARAPRRGASSAAQAAQEVANGAARSLARFGVARTLLARMAGVSQQTVAGWEKGRKLSPTSLGKLEKVEFLLQGLARVMRPDFLPTWLQQPNPACGGERTPAEVIAQGEHGRIERMIYFLESGDPS